MEPIYYSPLLQEMLACAQHICGGAKEPLTVERFLLTAAEFLIGTIVPTHEEELERFRDAVAHCNMDIMDTERRMRRFLQQERDPEDAVEDTCRMGERLEEARCRAEEAGRTEITPAALLDCILRYPYGDPTEPAPAPDWSEVARKVKELQDRAAGKTAAPEPAAGESHRADPIAILTAKTKWLQQQLLKEVFGQDHAVHTFAAGYFQTELQSITEPDRRRPGTFLFAGPPGVGKTMLAERVAHYLGRPFQRYDMSEYCDKEAALEFCGSDKVYHHGGRGNFTSFIHSNPKSVVLLDEIEKAHTSIIHLFLQILDAGRIRDNFTDEELPLKDTILIFTTNAGRQLYEASQDGDFSGVSRKVILRALQKDVNPATGQPYFPAAICSRFAAGNVVMFNHMQAHHLRSIVEHKVAKRLDNFRKRFQVDVELDEHVYSALLFAEGGTADGRTVSSRADAFIDGELFELYRLAATRPGNSIRNIQRIRVGTRLPAERPELLRLFRGDDKPRVLLFAGPEAEAACRRYHPGIHFTGTDQAAQAEQLLREQPVSAVLIDFTCGRTSAAAYLNPEDTDSAGRDFFRRIRRLYSGVPVYLLQTGAPLSEEVRMSYRRQGVRDFIPLTDESAFRDAMDQLCRNLLQQSAMQWLARSNKVVTYETGQTLTDGGATAEITLFDFRLETAVESEDVHSVLSSISRPDVTFEQVIGAEEAKKELKFFVDYLKNPRKYVGTGVGSPRGLLLYGPPGTGKTLLAKAVAGESEVTFLSAEGNQFLKRGLGEGPESVHRLFRTARKYAPSILFIDEIDAIALNRAGGGDSSTLTALLTEMDGFHSDPGRPVLVLAATNADITSSRGLDPALLRRFDRRICIDLPNRRNRIRYMTMRSESHRVFTLSKTKIENIAIRATGMSLADLESVFELALRSAIRAGEARVTDAVLEEAFETYTSGERNTWDEDQLLRVARHEAGHALLSWRSGIVPAYITIVARGSHGGYVHSGDREGKHLYTQEEMLEKIRMSLGGRAAEIVYYGADGGISTGASGDLVTATRLAQQMICSCGMSDTFGLAVVDGDTGRTGEMAREIRQEVNRILNTELQYAVQVLNQEKEKLDRLVKRLMAENQLTGAQLLKLFSDPSIGGKLAKKVKRGRGV